MTREETVARVRELMLSDELVSPGGRIILIGKNIPGADLSGANFDCAFLQGTDLSETDLSGANFNSADLTGANLRKANLSHATLVDAHLLNADLRGTNLSQADLYYTNLDGAKYNAETTWPDGTDPKARGALLENECWW